MTTTRLSTQVSEGSTPTYRCLIVDDLGVPILSGSLQTLTLTICESQGTRDVIDSRSAVNILNVNQGNFYDPPQLDGGGNQFNIMVLLRPTDTVMLNPALDLEYRSIIIEWTYNHGLSIGKHEVQFPISQIRPG